MSKVLLSLLFASVCLAEETFTVDDLLQVKRVSDAQLSPDGKWVAYTLGIPNLEDNKVVAQIWLVASDGKQEPKQFTNHTKGANRARWSPDGKSITFLSSQSGSTQLWLQPLAGGETQQITNFTSGVSMHVWSPTGDKLAFVSEVFPEAKSAEENQHLSEEREKSAVKAMLTDHLMFRHWDSWREGKRSHLFLLEKNADGAWSTPRDLTPGVQDIPPISLGGPEYFAFSPDGAELAYTRGADPAVEAWSTNADLWLMDLQENKSTNITAHNKGWDGSPVYSLDGKYIAYISQERDGYESDLVRAFLYDRQTKKHQRIFAEVNNNIDRFIWNDFSSWLFAEVSENGRTSYWGYPKEWDKSFPLIPETNFQDLQILNGEHAIAVHTSFTQPKEIHLLTFQSQKDQASINSIPLTKHNDELFSKRVMPSYESISYEGALGHQVQAWVLKPPGFDAKQKYPLLLFIHGGPQGAWSDSFHLRWNCELFAAQGYVVMAPNPHGSTGFGHEFTEQISTDWGGAAYEDLMRGVDWIISRGYVDENRMGALGGSYGGYMVNWMLGHTERFKAFVSHAGVYNLSSFYGATEELWFAEWDLGGAPWEDRKGAYQKYSPHLFAENFKTPTLVIHGQLDFRVPVTEGFQLFTALQRQGVASRLLYYPDEGHWILKLQNAKLWNETVLNWLNQYVKGASQ